VIARDSVVVMPGFMPGIHAFFQSEDVDGRDKHHDGAGLRPDPVARHDEGAKPRREAAFLVPERL